MTDFTIRATCYSDDHKVTVKFDALAWFQQATADNIKQLAECGWGGDYPGDWVAEFFADDATEAVYEYIAFRQKYDDGCGYECHIDANDAKAWLQANRPDVAAILAEIDEDND